MAVIAHLANFHGPRSGGLKTMMNETAKGYVAAGHEVHHFVPGDRTETTFSNGIYTHRFCAPTLPLTGGYKLIVWVKSVISTLERISPDIIEISDRTTLLQVADWAKARGVPTTMFAHERLDGVVHQNAKWLPAGTLADIANTRAASRVDYVVCTTSFAAEEFERLDHPTVHIPLGVDLEHFHPMRRSDDTDDFRSHTELILCSRFSPEKRCDFAIEVAREAARRDVDVRLTLVGDGPLRHRLSEQAVGLPVRFAGFVTDRNQLATLLANADLMLAPGPIETFGLAALEGLASGTPVIANAASAVPEVIGDAGLSRELEASQWVEAIVELMARPEHERRARARQRAEQFSWSATVDALLQHHGLKELQDV